MKSPVLKDINDFLKWANAESVFGTLRPTHYPAIVTTNEQGTLAEVVYYSEFQSARWVLMEDLSK